jgi:probable 2-oxoglutarate dehydrogenase E1 component DHKTD1
MVEVARVMDVAFKYRNFFRKVSLSGVRCAITKLKSPFQDIIVDLITYRRWYGYSSKGSDQYLTNHRGHNELDEPSFTQPLMYQEIRQRESVPKRYEENLIVGIRSLFISVPLSTKPLLFSSVRCLGLSTLLRQRSSAKPG